MAKKRKTRKQKLTSDLRSQVQHVSIVNEEQPKKKETPGAFIYTSSVQLPQATNITVLTQDYQYVTKDLLKTAMVTVMIVSIELILFFSTKEFNG